MGQPVSDVLQEKQATWTELYSKTLPSAAKKRAPAQKKWPVSLDHCFARIILDNAVGKDVPWMSKIKSPAYKNMTLQQLSDAIALGQGILEGTENLMDLNQKSLDLRGKKGPSKAQVSKRKAKDDPDTAHSKSDKEEADSPVNSAQSRDAGVKKFKLDDSTSFDIASLNNSSDLKPYRKKVLQLLYTVPRGQWTTYKAMSNALSSSPRAVGNAMRNNPFAPYVPCHRVLASDGSIGGFGGSWGEEGLHAKEKVRLLREEGVKFDGKGKAVGRPYTFAS